ncbi:MAG: nucleotide exchange factor GrpE [Chloroflexi bacterium]|nr:nucleotide exchange factor GrpE [Chloroflexota bacterium]
MSSKKDKMRRAEPEAEQIPEALPGQAEGPAPEAAPDTFPALEELQKQLAEAQSQAAEYKDGWQRALADFQNYKRRTDAEKADAYQNAVGTVVKRYLPILDDLERALATRPADLPWVDGIELVYRKLQTILENEGLKRIEAEGQPFDPNFHEAISQEPAEGVESGRVIGVIQQGYTLGERVIRPAMVRVAQ